MSGIRLIYTLFGSAEEARSVAKALIKEKLAACANHLAPVTSQYMWDGALQEEQEFPVLLKTGKDQVETAMKRLKSLHSYDVPAIMSFAPDACDNAYAAWLAEQLEN